ncbi:MAG TPA: hypothetical protein VJL29_06640 [Thermoguttaceae bacterium]|nr:hypothetical protein [Thermoguttaceae bacterium]
MSASESAWKTLFAEWPAELPRKGILVTTLNEPIPFNGFMIGDHFVVISRNAPDALGARTVLLPYESLFLLKMTDVIKSKAYQAAGFRGELGQQ